MTTFEIINENKEAYYVQFVTRRGNVKDDKTEPELVKRWVKKKYVRALHNILRTTRKKDYDEDGKIGCHYICEKLCKRFGLKNFFHDGEFNWKEFFGTRNLYHNAYNLPMNILNTQGKIIYHKNGKATYVK